MTTYFFEVYDSAMPAAHLSAKPPKELAFQEFLQAGVGLVNVNKYYHPQLAIFDK